MIQPALKNLVIVGDPNIYGQLEINNEVNVGDDFLLSGTACVGTDGTDACDLFDFTVVSPKALARKVINTGLVVGRGYFIIEQFSIGQIEYKVKEILSKHSAETWEELSVLLRPYFYWEYEKE
ncbi:Imm8 family immunity protein [Paenibacillus luteus]|uniref:Imm8 family immunity protein n=1 Tax=Paenibacillus luteus TaxID=2545753 RepID=UPI001142901C|nr:Imm8 family immunity protein [Paenibacillus luteus]